MPGLKTVACTVPKKTVTKFYPEKTEKCTKGRIRAMSPTFQSHTSLSICIPSFQILASIVLEKTVTQKNLPELQTNRVTDLRNHEETNPV